MVISPHYIKTPLYTVGYWNGNYWYFNGEYENERDAINCAQRTANDKHTLARVTCQTSMRETFFDPQI